MPISGTGVLFTGATTGVLSMVRDVFFWLSQNQLPKMEAAATEKIKISTRRLVIFIRFFCYPPKANTQNNNLLFSSGLYSKYDFKKKMARAAKTKGPV
jgi:hypothetical protein